MLNFAANTNTQDDTKATHKMTPKQHTFTHKLTTALLALAQGKNKL
jgi:hypothetical protein